MENEYEPPDWDEQEEEFGTEPGVKDKVAVQRPLITPRVMFKVAAKVVVAFVVAFPLILVGLLMIISVFLAPIGWLLWMIAGKIMSWAFKVNFQPTWRD